jgi:hypothetical protein
MKMMTKRWIAPAAILLLTSCSLPAFAADATGKWTCQDRGPEAQVVTLTFVFKQEGTKLTGTLTITDDSDKILDSTSINNGKVDGDKISFGTEQTDGARHTLEGTIHPDDITLTVRGGDDLSDISEITLKRSK